MRGRTSDRVILRSREAEAGETPHPSAFGRHLLPQGEKDALRQKNSGSPRFSGAGPGSAGSGREGWGWVGRTTGC